MTFAEQEEEAKEELLQKELLEQLEKEQAIEKAGILEEQRANAERERMKELKKPQMHNIVENDDPEDEEENTEKKKMMPTEERPYRRDYSLPERSQPYGSWQTVQTM